MRTRPAPISHRDPGRQGHDITQLLRKLARGLQPLIVGAGEDKNRNTFALLHMDCTDLKSRRSRKDHKLDIVEPGQGSQLHVPRPGVDLGNGSDVILKGSSS